MGGDTHNHTVCVVRWRTATSATPLSTSNLKFNKSATDLRHPESGTESHCARENRYIRYIVANQQLKALQIRYTTVTTVTLLSISNLSSPVRSPRFKRVPNPQ